MNDCPQATEIIEYIIKKIPTQKKKLVAMEVEFPNIKIEIEKFLNNYAEFFHNNQITLADVSDAYVTMIQQVVEARLYFLRSGRYPVDNQKMAEQTVYANPILMKQYMLGLALSTFIWRHHYQILQFFRANIEKANDIKRVLEIGSGHGLFCQEALQRMSTIQQFDIVDISATSLQITREILRTIDCKDRISANINFWQADIMSDDVLALMHYDWISMGEVLEHVDDPQRLLNKVARRLTPQGKLYISTCVNSPAIDHVYHFCTINEIRRLIQRAGLVINAELIAPSDNRELTWLEKNKIDISYAAILMQTND